MRPVYDRTDALDGYVSIEVNPKLAFERLFGSAEAEKGRAERDLYRKSIRIP